MAEWAGAVVALRGASEDAIASRLPTYLHPLAGRSLAWHVLTAVVALEPAPRQLRLVTGTPVDPAVFGGPPVEPIAVKRKEAWWSELSQSLGDGIDRVLVVDAAAPMLSRSLTALTAGPLDRVLRGQDGELLAIWASRELLDRIARDQRMEDAAREIATASPADPAEAFLVRDRAALARASVMIRDRIVRRHMAAGVSFLLPDTVYVDVEVVIGRDTVIYPGVVLEGETQIGAETVVGPGCRVIDSRVGNGVELKGWNYLVGTTIRNRAVLEPYVRRGFD